MLCDFTTDALSGGASVSRRILLATLTLLLAGCSETETTDTVAQAPARDEELSGAAPTADGAGRTSSPREALDAIMTASGDSALERMERCGMKIRWKESWIDDDYAPDARGGLTIAGRNLDIYFDVPPEADGLQAKDVLARWVLKDGQVTPINGWARRIQNDAPPLGGPEYLNC